MTKTKILLVSILSFLGVLTNVKAVTIDYDFSGYNKATQVQFGLYNNTTLVQDALTTCTSSNDGFCAFENGDLSNTEVTFNNLRFVIRGTDGVTFTSGGQYKMSFFFLSNTSDYYITAGTLTNTTGVSYQNFSNWTANDLGIVSSNIIAIETQSTGADTTATLYRVDIVFSVSSSTVAGFNIRLYRNSKTIYSSTPCDIELFRYFSVIEVTPGSIDYSQDLNNINQSIGGLSDDISDSTQDIINNQNANTQAIQNTINDNFQDCGKNLVKDSMISVGSLSNSTGADNNNRTRFRTSFIPVKAGLTYSYSVASGYSIDFFNYYSDGTFISTQSVYGATGSVTIATGVSQVRLRIQKVGSTSLSESDIPNIKLYFGSNADCTNKLDALNDSLTDSNTSSAENKGSSFFSNFTETDHGGISAIITAPLVVVRSMLVSGNQCVDLQFNVMNTNVSFPSGCILWSKADSNITSIWQMIVCGFVSYLLLKKLFIDIERLKNPENSEVSTLDL